ncbi:PREDICTED: uncharacterized protein C12orf50 homolog, partial [Acanthisitta chloris]|uniref:uncharacterized protein C12orf50 homolog n=1 Tax=Acanthisitta chloris TaxID=57068 RepID=UPI0004F0D42A
MELLKQPPEGARMVQNLTEELQLLRITNDQLQKENAELEHQVEDCNPHTDTYTSKGPGAAVPLQRDVVGGILHPAHYQDSLRNQENIPLLICLPRISNIIVQVDDEEDDEEDEEMDYVSTWVPKTAADIEEARAIKEICYISGQYYGIQSPNEHQSTHTVKSPWQAELLPLEATEQNFQNGTSNTIPTKFSNTRKEKESSERTVVIESTPRTDRTSFVNGGGGCTVRQRNTLVENRCEASPWEKEPIRSKYSNVKETNHTELVKNRHCKEVKKNKWISKEPRNLPNTGTDKGKYTSESFNAQTWRRRNPEAKSSSKF